MGNSRYSCSHYQSGLYTIQEPSYLGKTAVVSIWIRMESTLIIIRVLKDFSHLDIPTKYQLIFNNDTCR